MARDMVIRTATPTTDTGCLEKAPSGRSAKPIADLPRDRLARNVAFISNLMESGVEFRAVDFPRATRLTVHILAALSFQSSDSALRDLTSKKKPGLSATNIRRSMSFEARARLGLFSTCLRVFGNDRIRTPSASPVPPAHG